MLLLLLLLPEWETGTQSKWKEANRKSKYENENGKMWLILSSFRYVHRNLHKTECDRVFFALNFISDIFDSRHYQSWWYASILSENELWSGSSGSRATKNFFSNFQSTENEMTKCESRDQLKNSIIIHMNIFRFKSSIHSSDEISCSRMLVNL